MGRDLSSVQPPYIRCSRSYHVKNKLILEFVNSKRIRMRTEESEQVPELEHSPEVVHSTGINSQAKSAKQCDSSLSWQFA